MSSSVASADMQMNCKGRVRRRHCTPLGEHVQIRRAPSRARICSDIETLVEGRRNAKQKGGGATTL